MRNWNCILMVFAILFISSCGSNDSSEIEKEEQIGINFVPYSSLESLQSEAKKNKKDLLVVVQAEWDGPSKWMESSVYSDPNVAAYYNGLYLCSKVVVKKGHELKEVYQITEYPTFLFFNKEGYLMHRVIGASESMSFIEFGVIAKDSTRNLDYFNRTYTKGGYDIDFLRKYAMTLYDAGIENKEVVNEYLMSLTATDYFEEDVFFFLMAFLKDVKSKNAGFVLQYQEQLIAMYGEEEYNTLIYQITHGQLAEITELSENQLEPILKYVKDAQIKHGDKLRFELKLNYFERKKDWKSYGDLLKRSVHKLYKNNPSDLNHYANEAIDKIKDQAVLKEAKSWMKRAIKIDPTHYYLETYSNLLFKLKEFDKAKYAIDKAIELAQKEGSYIDKMESLREKLEKKLKK